MPIRRASGQAFNSPSSRIRSFDIQHTDNPSLHDNASPSATSAPFVPPLTRPESLLGEQKVVTSIVSRIVNKLPCNSGIKLVMMEIDEGVKTTVESLLQISRIRLPLVVNALASALETLSKYSSAGPLVDAPLDTIHSQLYLLHLLLLCLSESWRFNSVLTPPPQSDLPQCWPDPPPLDDNLARHLLSVLVVYTRMLSQDSNAQSGQTPPAASRDPKSVSSAVAGPASRQSNTASATSFSLGAKFIQQHSYPGGNRPPLPLETNRLLAPSTSSVATAVQQVTEYTARALFYLSASNWPLVLSRIKARVAHLTTTVEDNPELVELRLLGWANLDSSRLAQALQEISTPFLHVKRPAQTALATALRKAIWNWIDVYPAEYQALIEGNRKLDGNPDTLFDMLMSTSETSASNKRAKVFYPLMVMLLVLMPDTLKRISLGESSRSSGLSKKISFMENLRKGLGQAKSFEACAVCYVDLLRAAMSCSPRCEGSGIRSLVPDIQSELKSALFYSPLASEITDTNVLVDGLVALYRSNPSGTSSLIFPKLWSEPDNSRTIGVRACVTIVTEGQWLPWHTPVSGLRTDVAPSVRGILAVQSKAFLASGSPQQQLTLRSRNMGRGSIDIPLAQVDLTWEILQLLASDAGFAFESVGEGADTLSSLMMSVSSLTSANCPMTIRSQAGRTNLVIMDALVESAKLDPSRAALAVNTAPAMWQILIDSSRQVLIDFQNGDVDDMALMCGAFRNTTDAILGACDALPDIMTKAPNARAAVLIAKVATITSLTGPDVEQTNLSSNALLALSRLILQVRTNVANGVQMEEIKSHSNMLAELGSLPPSSGRHQQQRAIRRVVKQHVRASTLMSSVWLGLAGRAKALQDRIHNAEAEENNVDGQYRRRNLAADIEGLSESESKEWQNLVAFLCCTSGVCLQPDVQPSIGDIVGKGILPRVYEESTDIFPVVESFLRSCVDFLISNQIHVRESVKDALGNELPLSLSRVLVVQMTKLLQHSITPSGIQASDMFTTFVEQAITVLRLTVDRASSGDHGAQVDMGELLYIIAQYIHRLNREDAYLRIKIKFCQLIEAVLNKPEFVVLGNAGKLRNALLEWMCEWSIEATRDNFSNLDKTQRDLDQACLRAMVPVTDGLVLRPPGDDSEDTQGVVKSRLFYRYYHMLVRVLEKSTVSETESSQLAMSVSGLSLKISAADSYPSLAILVLSNLLSANIDVGLRHCLTLGYHEDPTIRTAFMQLLTNILQQGARFGGLAVKGSTTRSHGYFDALTGPNMALAMAIIEVCPPSEIDEISGLLFRAFEARGNLLTFMKTLVEREVSLTNHESELFRANSITTRLLTVYAKTFGYNYVRSALQPLVYSLSEKRAECSFELDPSKITGNENIETNAEHLRVKCQELLDIIYKSSTRVPILFRALAHHIWEVVEERFPDSRHSAVGSFVFLRFFCPAIVAPEGVDIDLVSPDSRENRRALLLITKVIQNLANNVLFGSKEAHMKVLNQFLSENIRQVTKFLSDVAVRPKSWDLAQATKQYQEEAERHQDLEVDNNILHRFMFKHIARLEGSLENLPPTWRSRSSSSSHSLRVDFDGKGALAQLRRLMEDTGPPVESRLSPSARSQVYDDFMRHNAGRSTDSVNGAFYEGPVSQNGRRLFYFIIARVGMIEYDLLAYHVFSLLEKVTDFFDIIVDLTDYGPSSDLPVSWLKRAIQMCPPGILPCVNTVVLYNPNTYARRRLRRIASELVNVGTNIGKSVQAASSPAELAEMIPYNGLALPESTMSLAYEAEHVFTNLSCVNDHEMHVPVVVKLNEEFLQVASWRKAELTSTLKSYIIDIINLKDVDEVITGSGTTSDLLTVRYRQTMSMTFVSRNRSQMAQIIRAARSRLRDTPREDRALRPSDVPGTLLNVAILNLSSGDETLRLGAYNLINEICQLFKYDLPSQVLKVSTGLFIPSNSLPFVYKLSKAFATVAPSLTLEFLKEWTIGFTKADAPQKTACLHYITPWLVNLETFAKPSRDDGLENLGQVGEIVRGLIGITVAERKQSRLHLALQQHIWVPLSRSHEALIDIVTTEIMRTAVGSGPGSDKEGAASDILVSLSSTAIRGKLIVRLRKVLASTYFKIKTGPDAEADITETPQWNEICTLARINMNLAFNPQSQLDLQLFLPDLLYIILQLAGLGSVLMRQTIFGLLVNMLQSLATAQATGDMDMTTLQHLLNRVQQPEMINAFGLTLLPGSLELSGLPNWGMSSMQHLDSLDLIVRFLGDVLNASAVSTDCANSWRTRWMGLVAATAFKENLATLPQAYIALGYLASDEVDDDLVYQVVVALGTALSSFIEKDVVMIVAMLRCLSRMLPGLSADSKYTGVLFWTAVGVLQLSYIPLFGPALELLLTAVRFMDTSGAYSSTSIVQTLLSARQSATEPMRRLGQYAGVNFDADPYFSLVGIMYKGVRHPNTRKLTIATLTELLRLSSIRGVDSGSEDDSPLIGPRSVAFFAALLPIASQSPSELRALFMSAHVDVAEEELRDLSTLSVFDLLAIPDNSKALLLVTLIVTILGTASSDTERLVLYRLLAEASIEMPDVVAMAYDTLIPRMTAVLQTTSSSAILSAVTIIFERAMADTSYTFPSGPSGAALNDSTGSLHKKTYSASINSTANNTINPMAREQMLDELGMKGLADMSFPSVKMDRLQTMAAWVSSLIDAVVH